MFAKLLKYEWKANAKLLGILSAVAALLGVFACVIASVFLPLCVNMVFVDHDTSIITAVALSFFWLFLVISISVYAVAVTFILAYRFYKNKFTDEGYLTFTLPVTSKQIFLSSFVNMTLWNTIASVITLVTIYSSLIMLLSIISDFDFELIFDLAVDVIEYFTLSEGLFAVVQIVLALVSYLLAFITSIVTIHASITIGAVIVKRFKILAAIGIYYAINFGMSMLVSFAQYIPSFVMLITPSDVVVGFTQIAILLVQILIYAAIIVVGYKVSIKLMDEKLNLP